MTGEDDLEMKGERSRWVREGLTVCDGFVVPSTNEPSVSYGAFERKTRIVTRNDQGKHRIIDVEMSRRNGEAIARMRLGTPLEIAWDRRARNTPDGPKEILFLDGYRMLRAERESKRADPGSHLLG